MAYVSLYVVCVCVLQHVERERERDQVVKETRIHGGRDSSLQIEPTGLLFFNVLLFHRFVFLCHLYLFQERLQQRNKIKIFQNQPLTALQVPLQIPL